MYAANVVEIRRATEAGTPVLAGRRLPRRATIACALVCALAAPAVSSAKDGRALALTSSLAGTTSTPSQDLRFPDNRVPAMGQGTLGAPDGTVVKLRQPAPVRGNPGIDRGGSNIGAAIILGLIALGSAGAGAVAQRRQGGPRTATVA